jgi:hypothetical protein
LVSGEISLPSIGCPKAVLDIVTPKFRVATLLNRRVDTLVQLFCDVANRDRPSLRSVELSSRRPLVVSYLLRGAADGPITNE